MDCPICGMNCGDTCYSSNVNSNNVPSYRFTIKKIKKLGWTPPVDAFNRFEQSLIVSLNKGFNDGLKHHVAVRFYNPADDKTLEWIQTVADKFRCDFEIYRLGGDHHKITFEKRISSDMVTPGLYTNHGEKLTGTRWQRKDQSNVSESPEPGKHPYNGYTVLMVTNLSHSHPDHPPQVIYKGDNGKCWSLDLTRWPGSLEPETEDNFKKVPIKLDLDEEAWKQVKQEPSVYDCIRAGNCCIQSENKCCPHDCDFRKSSYQHSLSKTNCIYSGGCEMQENQGVPDV